MKLLASGFRRQTLRHRFRNVLEQFNRKYFLCSAEEDGLLSPQKDEVRQAKEAQERSDHNSSLTERYRQF